MLHSFSDFELKNKACYLHTGIPLNINNIKPVFDTVKLQTVILILTYSDHLVV